MVLKIFYNKTCVRNPKNTYYPNETNDFTTALKNDHVEGIFESNTRSKNNWQGATFCMFDIDDKLKSIEELIHKFKEIKFYYQESKSSTPEQIRLHIYFPLSKKYTDRIEFERLKYEIYENNTEWIDKNAIDIARFFYGCDNIVHYHQGRCIDLIPEGDRNSRLYNEAVKILKRFGDTKESQQQYTYLYNRVEGDFPKEEALNVYKSALKFYKDAIEKVVDYIPPKEYNNKMNNAKKKASLKTFRMDWDLYYSREKEIYKLEGIDDTIIITGDKLFQMWVDSYDGDPRFTDQTFQRLSKEWKSLPKQYLSLLDGTLDLETMEYVDLGHEYVINYTINATYKVPTAKTKEVLLTTLGNYLESKEAFLWDIGKALIGDTGVNRMISLTGIPGSGKSTVLLWLANLFNDAHTTTNDLGDFNTSFGMSQLPGKRLVTIDDTSTRQISIKQAAILKKLISCNPVMINKKYMQPFQYEPECTILYTSNEGIQLSGNGDLEAMIDRMRQYNMDKKIRFTDKQVDNFEKELYKLNDVLLYYALQMSDKDRPTIKDAQITARQIRIDSDHVFEWLEEFGEFTDVDFLRIKSLYDAFCVDNNYGLMGKITLKKRLEQCGVKFTSNVLKRNGKTTRETKTTFRIN